jgi:hypothetical protein
MHFLLTLTAQAVAKLNPNQAVLPQTLLLAYFPAAARRCASAWQRGLDRRLRGSAPFHKRDGTPSEYVDESQYCTRRMVQAINSTA